MKLTHTILYQDFSICTLRSIFGCGEDTQAAIFQLIKKVKRSGYVNTISVRVFSPIDYTSRV